MHFMYQTLDMNMYLAPSKKINVDIEALTPIPVQIRIEYTIQHIIVTISNKNIVARIFSHLHKWAM